MNINTPFEAIQIIADSCKKRRLEFNITQVALSARSGVSLSVLRLFERTGAISLESFLKLTFTLGLLDDLLSILSRQADFQTMDDILREKSQRKRARS